MEDWKGRGVTRRSLIGWTAAALVFPSVKSSTAIGSTGASADLRGQASFINVRDFGAIGNGIHVDTLAFAAALTHAGSTGAAIFIPKGIFILDPGVLQVSGWGSGASFTMYGEGASSILKIRDGTINADFKQLLRITPRQDMNLVDVHDLTVDMNARASPDPALVARSPWAFQHSATFFVYPMGCRVAQARFTNVIIKDPAADGFSISGRHGGNVGLFISTNCAVTGRTRKRSDICLTTMPDQSLIEGFQGAVLEIETNSATPRHTKLTVSNSDVKRLDMSEKATGYLDGNVEIYLENVTAPESCNFDGVMLLVRNCKLGISNGANGTQSRWNVLQAGSQISDSTFIHHYDAEANAAASLTLWSNRRFRCNSHLKLVNCHSVIDNPDNNIRPKGAAIRGAPISATFVGNSLLEISGHSFDPRFEISVHADRCGTVRLTGNVYGGTTAAIHYQSGARKGVDLTVDGGEFHAVTGASVMTTTTVVDQRSAIGHLRLTGNQLGVAKPWVDAGGGLPSTVNNQLNSDRRMPMDALPQSGILGDIVELRTTATGQFDNYRCTASGNPASWTSGRAR